MTDPLRPTPATDATGFLPGALGLRLDESFLALMALRAAPHVLDQLLPFGHVVQVSETITLRFSPNVLWHSGPLPTGPWRTVDISHGMTHLRLRGVEALHFLANYTTVDLHSAQLRQLHCVRTRLNHYDCAMWWTSTRDVHILIDRSYAQSFCDHLRTLALRHPGVETTQSLRPVAPDAPDRRG